MVAMATPVHQLYLDSSDAPRFTLTEYTSTVTGLPAFCVHLVVGTSQLDIYCPTADQVRALVPAFVSKAEQAQMDTEDEIVDAEIVCDNGCTDNVTKAGCEEHMASVRLA